jgi:ribosomal protein S18 acetylase RimI-like enzyme
MSVHLREAVFPDDEAAIAAIDTSFTTDTIYAVTFDREHEALALNPETVDPPVTKRFPIDGLSGWRAWEHGWVACEHERIVGFVAWRMQPWNKHVIVWHLYVDRPARGNGAGGALLDHAIGDGIVRGATIAWLETSNLDHPAVQWYRRRGFEISGVDLTRYEQYAPGEVALYLSRRLGP